MSTPDFIVISFFILIAVLSFFSVCLLYFKRETILCDHKYGEWVARKYDIGWAESYQGEVARFCNKCNYKESHMANNVYSFGDLIIKAKKGEL